MENASKALIIAGGILLAIMILALLVSVGISMSDMVGAQDEKILIQQTQEFNNQYLAYNKSVMYGIDVITVANKIIDYNTKIDVDEETKMNFILKLNEDFNTIRSTVVYNRDGTIRSKTSEIIKEKSLISGTHELFGKDNPTLMDNNIINFFHQDSLLIRDTDMAKEMLSYKISEKMRIQHHFEDSALQKFKTAIFECEDVGYSEITGRINSITFKQI